MTVLRYTCTLEGHMPSRGQIGLKGHLLLVQTAGSGVGGPLPLGRAS